MTYILVFSLILAVTLYWVLEPLVLPHRTELTAHADPAADLRARVEILLQELRDLELEHEAGKMDDATYTQVQRSLRAELAQVLAQLELEGEA